MLKVTSKADCGNSPKKLFLQQFNVAFAEGDIAFLTRSISDDIVWNMVGDKAIQGKAAFESTLQEMEAYKADALVIHHIVTHGREASINGELTFPNGERYAFCDMVEFSGAKGDKIKSLTSYVIKL